MKKIKIGLLTAGGIARTMASTITRMDSVEAYAVAARDYDRAAAFASEYGFTKAYGAYETMLEDPEVDLIYVASPHSHHFEHVKLCLEHGKHVLCEKAFAVNAAQAEEMIALAREKQLLLAEAMWVRYMPMAKTLREILDSGIIGDISTVTANLYYVIDNRPRLVAPDLAGGALLDVGVYTLTFASLVMGDEIEKIHASAVKTDTGVDAQTSVTVMYPQGRMAVLNSGIMSISDRQGIIYGREGYIVVENINNFENINVYSLERKLITSIHQPQQISGYEYEVDACVRAIEAGQVECPEMTHHQSLQIVRQMDDIREQLGIIYPCE